MSWVLETERLRLREFDASDAQAFYELNSDPEVMRYTGDADFASVEESKQLILNYDQYERFGFGRWTVITRENNEVIGWCGLKRHEEGYVDIGFRLFQKEWNKGYATEAALAVLDYGFNHLNLDEVIGRASLENKASVSVLEKLGMQFWKNAPCEGIEDSVYHKITAKEFKSMKLI